MWNYRNFSCVIRDEQWRNSMTFPWPFWISTTSFVSPIFHYFPWQDFFPCFSMTVGTLSTSNDTFQISILINLVRVQLINVQDAQPQGLLRTLTTYTFSGYPHDKVDNVTDPDSMWLNHGIIAVDSNYTDSRTEIAHLQRTTNRKEGIHVI